MAKTLISIEHGHETSGDVLDLFEDTDKRDVARKIARYFTALSCGCKSGDAELDLNSISALGTVTVATPAADDTVVINGVTFTAKVSPSGDQEFALGADDNETATNLATKVAASALTGISSVVTASNTTGLAESSTVTFVADVSAKEVLTVTVPSTAAATQADYFVITNTAGAKAAFWLDIDAAGTTPTGAAYVAADSKIKVSISTGGSAIDNATILQAAAATILDYAAVDNLDGTVTYSETKIGTVTAPATHNADDTGAGSLSVSVGTVGAASALQNKYFTFKSANDAVSYYGWFNVNTEGVDPTPGGTGVAIAVTPGSSAVTIATTARSAIDALANITATRLNAVVTIANDKIGISTNVSAGNSGLTVATIQQGVDPVVTISAVKPGLTGNMVALSCTGGFTASGAALSGGSDGTKVSISF